jgi:hypothetical protein
MPVATRPGVGVAPASAARRGAAAPQRFRRRGAPARAYQRNVTPSIGPFMLRSLIASPDLKL